jgi:hypothetical protein
MRVSLPILADSSLKKTIQVKSSGGAQKLIFKRVAH